MVERQKDPQREGKRVVSLHDGANQRLAPWLIGETEAFQVEDLIIENVGTRTRRLGARAFGGITPLTPSEAAPGGFSDYAEADFDEVLISAWGHELFKSTGNGGWGRVCSGVSLAPAMLHQFEKGRHNGELALTVCTCEEVTDSTSIGINGRSNLVVYSIETDVCTQASLAPRCISSFQNRLFYGEGEVMGWSEIGDLVSYSDTNQLLIQPGVGGSEITALLPTRDIDQKLVVFKKRAIFLFTPRWGAAGDIQIPSAGDELDLTNSSVRPLSLGTGCVATRSVQFVPGEQAADVFFLAADGIRALSRAENDVQTGAGFPVSYKIPTWISRINFTHAHKASASVFDNSYYLAVPMDGAIDNTHIIRYDIANKAWSLYNWQIKDLLVSELNTSENIWMQNNFGTRDSSVTAPPSSDTSQIYRLFEGSFDPSTDETNQVIPVAREESRAFTLGDPMTKKQWDRFTLEISSGDTARIEVAYRRDLGAYTPITEFLFEGSADTIVLGQDALPWNSSTEITRKRTFSLKDIGPSYNIQFRVGGVTGATETGQVSTYFSEVKGHLLTDEFANDP